MPLTDDEVKVMGYEFDAFIVKVEGNLYRGSLVKMGTPCHIIGISKDIRGRNGKCPGDTVHVIIAKDDEPRVVEVPSDLKAEMDRNPHARSTLDKLSYSHQREHVAAILEAKRPETRKMQIEKAIAILIEERHRQKDKGK